MTRDILDPYTEAQVCKGECLGRGLVYLWCPWQTTVWKILACCTACVALYFFWPPRGSMRNKTSNEATSAQMLTLHLSSNHFEETALSGASAQSLPVPQHWNAAHCRLPLHSLCSATWLNIFLCCLLCFPCWNANISLASRGLLKHFAPITSPLSLFPFHSLLFTVTWLEGWSFCSGAWPSCNSYNLLYFSGSQPGSEVDPDRWLWILKPAPTSHEHLY